MDRAGRYAARLGRCGRYTPPNGLQSIPQERVQNAPTAATAALSPRLGFYSSYYCDRPSPGYNCPAASRRRRRNDTLRTRGICLCSCIGIADISISISTNTCPSTIHPPQIQDCHPPFPQDPASCIRCDHLGAQRKGAACAHGTARRLYIPDGV